MRIEYYVGDEITSHLMNILTHLHKTLKEEGFRKDNFISEYNPNAMHHLLIYKDSFKPEIPPPFLRELLGFITYIEYDGYYYLMVISVLKEYSNTGVGTMLLMDMKKRVKECEIWCKINRENKISRSFFEKYGFRKRLKRDIPDGITRCYRQPYDGFSYNNFE